MKHVDKFVPLRFLAETEFLGTPEEGFTKVWGIVCLEYFVAAQGKSLGEAMDRIKQVMQMQHQIDTENGQKPFEHIKPAPQDIQSRLLESQVLCGHLNFWLGDLFVMGAVHVA